MGRRLTILGYHHVGHAPIGSSPFTLTPSAFRRHLRALSRAGYQTINPRDWLLHVTTDRPLPQRPLLLTFDDGYADLAEHCFPVLEEFSFTATTFLVTSLLGKTNEWDEGIGFASQDLLPVDAVKTWQERGFVFGAHTRTHANLAFLTPERVRDEVAGSKSDLTRILGEAPDAFAYPYGSVTPAAAAIVADTFGLGITTMDGWNARTSDPARLRRSIISPNDTTIDVLLRARFGASLPNKARRRVARLASHRFVTRIRLSA